MRINPERLETDNFHRRVSGRITFCHLFSLPEPVGAESGQIELKVQNQNLDIETCPLTLREVLF
jgi:hypothetical protein